MKSSSPTISIELDKSVNKPRWLERIVIQYLSSVLKNSLGSLQLVLPSKYCHQFGTKKISANNPKDMQIKITLL